MQPSSASCRNSRGVDIVTYCKSSCLEYKPVVWLDCTNRSRALNTSQVSNFGSACESTFWTFVYYLLSETAVTCCLSSVCCNDDVLIDAGGVRSRIYGIWCNWFLGLQHLQCCLNLCKLMHVPYWLLLINCSTIHSSCNTVKPHFSCFYFVNFATLLTSQK